MSFTPRRLLAVAALAACLAPATAQVPAATEEVPFITSPDNVTLEMLRLAGVRPGDHVIDLGSGDGRIVITAAKRFGATGLGVEIVPELVQRSVRSAREAGVADKVEFREQDLFKTDLAPATVVTMYLLPEVNLQLRPALLALRPGTRVVSHDWDMGDWKPDQTTVVPVPDKKVGLEKTSKIHLWVVPARLDGLWCGNPQLGPTSLEVKQNFQELQGRLARKGRVREGRGRIQGNVVQIELRDGSSVELELAGDTLLAGGRAADPAHRNFPLFTRAKNDRC